MKKTVESKSRIKTTLLLIVAVLVGLFILLPLLLSFFSSEASAKVALIPLEGVLSNTPGTVFGDTATSANTIINFLAQANENPSIKAIVLQINSPGGTPVATDEVATAIKNSPKPVIAFIKDVGASSGYWIASSTEYIIANRMSITGSIGVFSSYLEFSGLMDKYGVGYERLVAGEYKDMGVPYRKLTSKEKNLLQSHLDQMHEFFIAEVAENRNLPESEVRRLATGEVFLGVQALELGLIDQVGNIDTVKDYLAQQYGLADITFLTYQQKPGLFDLLTGMAAHFSFSIGEGLGSTLFQTEQTTLI